MILYLYFGLLSFSALPASQINRARGQRTWQSSVYDTKSQSANAVDGDYNPAHGQGSVAMTNSDDHAWWAVDLGTSVNVSHVSFMTRDTSSKCIEYSLLKTESCHDASFVVIGRTAGATSDDTDCITNNFRFQCSGDITRAPIASQITDNTIVCLTVCSD